MIKNKKGVSEMVGYVLLIVIAISASVMVYAFLSAYILNPPEKCDDGVSLIVEDYICNAILNTLNITVKNQGTISFDGFMIHGSSQVMKWFPLEQTEKSGTNGQILFEGNRLNASKSRNFVFDYGEYSSITNIEIKPIQLKNDLIICESAIITQDVRGCN